MNIKKKSRKKREKVFCFFFTGKYHLPNIFTITAISWNRHTSWRFIEHLKLVFSSQRSIVIFVLNFYNLHILSLSLPLISCITFNNVIFTDVFQQFFLIEKEESEKGSMKKKEAIGEKRRNFHCITSLSFLLFSRFSFFSPFVFNRYLLPLLLSSSS